MRPAPISKTKDRQSYDTANAARKRRWPADPLWPRPASRKNALASVRAALIAGTTPKSAPIVSETINAKANNAAVDADLIDLRQVLGRESQQELRGTGRQQEPDRATA